MVQTAAMTRMSRAPHLRLRSIASRRASSSSFGRRCLTRAVPQYCSACAICPRQCTAPGPHPAQSSSSRQSARPHVPAALNWKPKWIQRSLFPAAVRLKSALKQQLTSSSPYSWVASRSSSSTTPSLPIEWNSERLRRAHRETWSRTGPPLRVTSLRSWQMQLQMQRYHQCVPNPRNRPPVRRRLRFSTNECPPNSGVGESPNVRGRSSLWTCAEYNN